MREDRCGGACAPAQPLALPGAGRRRAFRRILAALLLVAGAGIAAAGLYHPAKARLGQHLLAAAWDETRAGRAARPWSWADFAPIARISVPRLGVSQIALSEASGAAMAWGPGRVAGAAPPGGAGLVAYAGHRDSHFAFLRDLRPGDVIEVETAGAARRYRVAEGLVVDSRIWRFPRGGRSRLALSTCWPFGAAASGPLRLVIFADAVGMTEVASADPP